MSTILTKPGEEPVITASEAAKLFGVAVQTIHQWVEKGLLEAWRTPGGHRRILERSALALLARRNGETHRNGEPAPFHVLVVEDDPRMSTTYRMHLKSWAFRMHVESATGGVEALINVAKRRPDLIITDLVMPDLDGFRLIKEMRADPEMRAIHLIVITILDNREIQAKGGLPEDVMVLQKPVQFSWLKEIIRQRLHLHESQRDERFFHPPDAPA